MKKQWYITSSVLDDKLADACQYLAGIVGTHDLDLIHSRTVLT